MFDIEAIGLMKTLSLRGPNVRTTYSDTAEYHGKFVSVEHNLDIYNFTGDDYYITYPSGLTVLITPTCGGRPEWVGKIVISERNFSRKDKTCRVGFPGNLTEPTYVKAYQDFSYHKENSSLPKLNMIINHEIEPDPRNPDEPILVPQLMVTVQKYTDSRLILNLAARSTSFASNKTGVAGRHYAYVSKDYNSQVYIVFANNVLRLVSSKQNVTKDHIEVYETRASGEIFLLETISLEDAMTGTFEGTRVFKSEVEAVDYQKRLLDAVDRHESLVRENSTVKERLANETSSLKRALETERDAHSATKRKAHEDTVRSEATLWGKTAAVFSSIASLFSGLISMVRSVFN